MLMTSGIARKNSSITDVSMMFGGGAFSLMPGETRQIAFALAMDPDFDVVAQQLASARLLAMEMGLDAVPYDPQPLSDEIAAIEGGTIVVPGPTTVTFKLQNPSPVTMELYSVDGRAFGVVYEELNVPAGTHELEIVIPNASTCAAVRSRSAIRSGRADAASS